MVTRMKGGRKKRYKYNYIDSYKFQIKYYGGKIFHAKIIL